ncbi:M4 family peptidase [Pseudonocardiaceae bacterium YIM PH 21723]|nr:M4 family peptidase [Pseudonocardiaceae bacterium YIM PH 21723]
MRMRVLLAAAMAAGLVFGGMSYLDTDAEEVEYDEVANVQTGDADLREAESRELPDGKVITRNQFFGDIQVLGAQVKENVGPEGELESKLGKLSKAKLGVFPAVTEQTKKAAGEAAVKSLAASEKVDAATLQVTDVQPRWYDPSLFDLPGTAKAVPAYLAEVTAQVQPDTEEASGKWDVVLSAVDNSTFTSWPLVHTAVNRVVCDANSRRFNTNGGGNRAWQCGTSLQVSQAEGGKQSAVADVKNVFQFFGDTQNMFQSKAKTDLTKLIGADYGDGKSKALRATVRGCSNACPFRNAFWDGRQMFFGTGLTTDDISAHELSHGVTQHTAGLVYRGESGAINESLSDIFGEFTDMTNKSADDNKANRWQMGEGSAFGVIRDMSRPERFRNPNTYLGQFWATGAGDNGGVHTNSGVGNKLAFLIADGGSHNGQTVTGIGIDKSAALWFAVENTLTSTSNYADLGKALKAACKKTAKAKVAGMKSADCKQVTKAIKAVKIP